MLKDTLYKDLKNGQSVLLKSSAGTVILRNNNVAYLFNSQIEDDYLLVFNNTKNDDFGSLFFDIVKIKGDYSNLKTKAKPYDYKKIEKELLYEIQKFGINKLFIRLSKIQKTIIYKKAQIFAALEVFTGETFKTDEKVQRYEITKKDGTKIKQIALFDENEASWKGNNDLNVRKYDTVPFRRMIDRAKKDLESELFIFTCILMLWQYKPGFIAASRNLIEAVDQSTWSFENVAGIKEEIKEEDWQVTYEGLVDDNSRFMPGVSYVALYHILNKVHRQTNKNSFWVPLGKARKAFYKKAKQEKAEIIDSERIRKLLNINDKQKVKRYKKALLELPETNLYMVEKPDKEGQTYAYKMPIVLKISGEGIKDDKINADFVILVLNTKLFKIIEGETDYSMVEDNAFLKIVESNIPPKCTKVASRLYNYLLNYNHDYIRKNYLKRSYLSVDRAAEMIGWKAHLKQGLKGKTIKEINRYLDYLQKEAGVIEKYELLETGQYSIIFGY